MVKIHKISSSAFVQSGSKAIFKTGMSSSNLITKGAIFANGFKGINTGNSDSGPTLLVGTQSANGSLIECETTVNTPFQLSASGNFNHFTFIEKRSDGWFQISSGSQKGIVEKSFVDIEGKSSPGVYEYLVLAASTSSLKTVVKGTTVKIKSNP
jgi:hypothetical protein|tara:strand:- start:1432 stop:1893 length:462 start_codon:yes stop_codon:yes gene_type:complete